MSFAKLVHSAGLVCAFVGALIALAEIVHPAGEDLSAFHSSHWAPAHMIWWLGVVLLQFHLIGHSARHAEALGWLGLTGFILAFFGADLTAGILFLQSSAVPLIAPSSPSIANELLVGPVFCVLLNEVSFGGGIVLFSVATMRARVYPTMGRPARDHRDRALPGFVGAAKSGDVARDCHSQYSDVRPRRRLDGVTQSGP
jgi:hypothetical protein